MKTNSKKLSILIALITRPAVAWHCHPVCVDTILSHTVLKAESACAQTEELKLARTPHNYPLMGRYEVSYWQGAFGYKALVQDVLRQDCRDSCTGDLEWSQILQPPPFVTTEAFWLDNPNLHDDIDASYKLVPLTDDEAKAALAQAKKRCEQAAQR